MKYSSNRSRGFTIIELIVIVAIILVLTTLSVNGLSNLLQWNKLNTIAIQLRADLRLAQANAFYEGVYYKIEFWTALNRYRIYKQTELYKDVQLEDVNLFNTNFTGNNLYFYPSGVPSQGGTVTLKNNRGKVLYVIMTPVTARIRISTKPPENW